ncbi:MAG: peptidylprolyl isomerase [Gammaproteobacteria bacterium]|jgi:FKBP-type peptidyl-prolyl cis-trans isomerase SlyD|nr:peptidylprolyl isomerase [Gammaproteobacteria bacterium]
MIISKNAVVRFYFELKDEKGNVVDKRNEPTQYLHGYQHILPLIEQALEGKTKNDTVVIHIPPEDAYGMPDEKLIRTLPISQFPSDQQLKVGMKVYPSDKRDFVMVVKDIDGDKVTLDANHPLAGQTLTFEMQVIDVRPATLQEITDQQAV